VTKEEKTGKELPAYLAGLRLTDVKKGDAKVGDVVIPKDIVGPWTVNYYPGELVLTHLAKRSGGVSYGLDLVERQARRHEGAGKHQSATCPARRSCHRKATTQPIAIPCDDPI
jgi:hypothetical protein